MPDSLRAVAALIPVVYLVAVTPALVVTDLRVRRLPNRIVVSGIVVALIAVALEWSLVPLIAAVAYAGFLFLAGLSGGIGMGDVKLAALLGLASPTPAIAVASPVLAFLLGGVAASIALVRRGRRTRIAFGPAMLAGYWLAAVLGAASLTA